MIASISGTITTKGDRFLIVETGGLGYQVYATLSTLGKYKEGDTAVFFTYHHVSETANDLYGFVTMEEVGFYDALLGISGIGPKTALNVMSVSRLEELKEAIRNNDATILTKVSGIGKKTAERIVLELADKLELVAGSEEAIRGEDGTVVDALVSLGYTHQDARDAVRNIPSSVAGVSERVREALKNLGRHGV